MQRGAHGVGIILALLLLAAIIVYAVRPGGDAFMVPFGDIVYFLFAGIAAFFGFLAVRVFGIKSPQGKVLLLLALMAAADAVAGIVWAYYEIMAGWLNPYPSIADGIWALFYVFGIAAFAYALRRVWKYITLTTLGMFGIGWVLLIIGLYSYVLGPIFAVPSTVPSSSTATVVAPGGCSIQSERATSCGISGSNAYVSSARTTSEKIGQIAAQSSSVASRISTARA